MPAAVTAQITELPESRVRVEAEVAAQEVEKRVAQAAKRLGGSLRVPGFRAGKVPPPVIIQRVGREAVLDEAVRESIGSWYAAAIDAARIAPIGEPDLDLGDLPGEGQPLRFSIEIGVRPKAVLGDWKGLEVPRREPAVTDDAVDEELARVRERQGKLESVERAAGPGDFVVMDFLGTLDGEPFPGGEGRDQMVELGSGRLVPGFEDQLAGAGAGESRTVTVTFPEDYPAESLAGREAQFAVEVKDVKERRLPELDEDFAAGEGFDTVEELRGDLRERLAEGERGRIEQEYREAALDAAVAGATVTVPHALVHARAHEVLEQMLHSLSHQGISKDAYLRIAGKTEEELAQDGEQDAEVALKREAVLAAIVEAEGIEPGDDELLEQVGPLAERQGEKPKKVFERLRSSGQLDGLRTELAQRRALDLLVEHATPIDPERAAAREKLWTPGA